MDDLDIRTIESCAFDLADASEALDYFVEDFSDLDGLTAAVELPRYAARLRAISGLIRRIADEANAAVQRGDKKPEATA